MGRPRSGGRFPLFASSRSAASASARHRSSGSIATIAFTLGFTRAICARCAAITSRAETFRARTSPASSRALLKHRSSTDAATVSPASAPNAAAAPVRLRNSRRPTSSMGHRCYPIEGASHTRRVRRPLWGRSPWRHGDILERRFAFDHFQLDLSTGRLSGQSGPIALTPKALAVLEYLAARPGQLISKDELLGAVWPGVFLGDGALKVCVSEIRRALGDDARSPRIIETAHRRGYRFIADVLESPPAPSPAPAVPQPASTAAHLPVHYAHSGDVNIAYQVLGTGRSISCS